MIDKPPLGQLPENPTDSLTADQHRERARLLIREAEQAYAGEDRGGDRPPDFADIYAASSIAVLARAHISMARELDRVAERKAYEERARRRGDMTP